MFKILIFGFLPQSALNEPPTPLLWSENVTQALARYEERAKIILTKYQHAPFEVLQPHPDAVSDNIRFFISNLT